MDLASLVLEKEYISKDFCKTLHQITEKQIQYYSDKEKYELCHELTLFRGFLSDYFLGYKEYEEVRSYIYEYIKVNSIVVRLDLLGVIFHFAGEFYLYFDMRDATEYQFLKELLIKQEVLTKTMKKKKK